MNTVLVVTSSIDCTVDYIIEKYKNDAIFFRLDVDHLSYYDIIIKTSGWEIVDKRNAWRISKHDIMSIYYRKPQFPDLEDFSPEYRNYIRNDIISVINGIVDDFQKKVLTKPSILRQCENKIFQLLYASDNNIQMPYSFIGNCNSELQKLSYNDTIIKPIYTGKISTEDRCELYQTSIFKDYNEDISLMPVYIQKYENKAYEVRLTIIDGKIYPIRINSKDKIDWRKAYDSNVYSIIDIPLKIHENVIKMMEDFNLAFGAFDYIVNPKGEWIFLEVNPNGQWLWLELELGINISRDIVDYLIRE